MWARIMRDRFGAKNPRSMMCRFHVQTAGSSLTAQSIDNNVVRTTIQALAAVLGGTQSLHTNARDEALALPTEEAARLALRTQQIIAHETGVTETPDPLAGSYYVETLTDRARGSRAGPTSTRSRRWAARSAAIEAGFQQRQIQEAAYRVQRAIESGDQVVVGVNASATTTVAYAADSSASTPTASASQVERFAAPRRARRRGLGAGDGGARARPRRGTENLLPPIIDAVKAHATLGEISDRLRVAWGEHRELITV